jgi:hypothetical protein
MKSAAVLMLSLVGICGISAAAQSAQPAPKYYRLTFVLTYPGGQKPPQSLAVDVPVTTARPGASSINMVSGPGDEEEGSLNENIRCTEVRESATGLDLAVAFTMDQVTSGTAMHLDEPLHRQVTINRHVNLVLGKPMPITGMSKLQLLPQKAGGEASVNKTSDPPEISVTAVRI